jgi:hypothetical protein
MQELPYKDIFSFKNIKSQQASVKDVPKLVSAF